MTSQLFLCINLGRLVYVLVPAVGNGVMLLARQRRNFFGSFHHEE